MQEIAFMLLFFCSFLLMLVMTLLQPVLRFASLPITLTQGVFVEVDDDDDGDDDVVGNI